jgi:hypothetical protein
MVAFEITAEVYSAWKSSNFRSILNTRSDILQLFGRLRSLQNFSLSEWRYDPLDRSPSLWKSVKYGRQPLYQQNGASAQHARPTRSRDRTRSQIISLLATSFEFGISMHPHFRPTKRS